MIPPIWIWNSYLLTILWIYFVVFEKQCDAAPTSTSFLMKEYDNNFLPTRSFLNITRLSTGDIFNVRGNLHCNSNVCAESSNGTAKMFSSDSLNPDISDHLNSNSEFSGICTCRCQNYLTAFREDLGICVNDLEDFPLSSFVSSTEKIPLIYLPLHGQIIHPSREINLLDLRSPICAVRSSQYLTTSGWTDLVDPVHSEFPFRMYRDEGKTFLQWRGESNLRQLLQGRIILIQLICDDMTLHNDKGLSEHSFNKCVAFKVSGSPFQDLHNVSEVSFQSESSSSFFTTFGGFGLMEFFTFGLCSFVLAIIYIISVLLYAYAKKKKISEVEPINSMMNSVVDINQSNTELTTCSNAFMRCEDISPNSRIATSSKQVSNGESLQSSRNLTVSKNNQFQLCLKDISGMSSDGSSSQCDEGGVEKTKTNKECATIHMPGRFFQNSNDIAKYSLVPSSQEEYLSKENVHIVKGLYAGEKLEVMQSIISGSIRRKLYFNPMYFEPHLLLSPPPTAIEFLTKIREVIAIAKLKMAAKKFQPSLFMIPEENSSSTKQKLNYVTSKSELNTSCSTNYVNICFNCGDKQNNVHKWLEAVSSSYENSAMKIKDFYNSSKMDENGTAQQQQQQQQHDAYFKNQNCCSSPTGNTFLKLSIPKIRESSSKTISNMLPSNQNSGKISVTQNSEQMLAFNEKMFAFSKPCNDIYNNPKFNHFDSPELSHTQKKSVLLHDSYLIRKKQLNSEILQNNTHEYCELMQNFKIMPNMMYEALGKDYSSKRLMLSETGILSNQVNLKAIQSSQFESNTIFHEKIQEIYNTTTVTDAEKPKPVSNNNSRKMVAARQQQPDSPIYRRRSPPYLIVDYETDSLERSSTKLKRINSCSPSSNNSSDSSSQPSPSLSTALPLEEEVEIRRTVYDIEEGYRKDGDDCIKKSMLRKKAYGELHAMNFNKCTSPRIIYDTPFIGSMTIELHYEPNVDGGNSTESDQFEPDTLDRKSEKYNLYEIKNSNMWSQQLNISSNGNSCAENNSGHNRMFWSENRKESKNNFLMKNRRSFQETKPMEDIADQEDQEEEYLQANGENFPSFGSLREIYQSKTQVNSSIQFTEAEFHLEVENSNENEITNAMTASDNVQSENCSCEMEHVKKNYKNWNLDDFDTIKIVKSNKSINGYKLDIDNKKKQLPIFPCLRKLSLLQIPPKNRIIQHISLF